MPGVPRKLGEPPAAFMQFGAGTKEHDDWASGRYSNRSYRYIVQRLQRALNHVEESSPDPLRVLVHFRELIEIEDGARTIEKLELPLLRLFTHWMVHPSVTKNPGANYLVGRIYEQVHARMLISTARGYEALIVYFADALLDVLSFPQLRRECRQLCARHDLPAAWCDSSSQWRGFVDALVPEIAGKPLGLPAASRSAPAEGVKEDSRVKQARKLGKQLAERRVHDTLAVTPLDITIRAFPEVSPEYRWAFRFTFNEAGEFAHYAVVIAYGEEESAFTRR